jgi:hypothetical protein
MKRFFALGLLLTGLLVAPMAVFAGGVPGPSVLSVPYQGPSVLAVPYNGRPSVLGIPQPSVALQPQFQHHRHFVPHRQPVWVQPQWMWNGWHWVWMPGYWVW